MAVFETSVTLECPQDEVFEFLIRPANLELISPPQLGLRFVDAPEVLELGSRLEFRVQGWGQVQTLVHEITGFLRPSNITETQVKGLFGLWVHDHRLEAASPGRIVVVDRVEFEPPGGLLGFLVTKPKILEHLEDAFHHRHEQMRKLLSK